jgi:DNA-binding CsgD family transcriptional regulator
MSDAFVGRHDELVTVREAGDTARAGRPMVVVLEGAAGSGKTTLAQRAIAELGSDATVVTITADELAATEPLALLRPWVGPDLADAPFAAGLALLDRLGELADGPLLAVLVEDLHWADQVSRLALLTTARRADHERLLLLVTTRPLDDAGWGRLADDAERGRRIEVGALSVEEVVELAAARGTPLTGRAARRLHEHTAGNALYVATLLRESSRDELEAADAELPVPRTLAATVAARVGELPADARQLLDALAVLNAPTPLPRLATVAGVTNPSAALDVLVETGYVTWRRQQLVGSVAFSHPLFRAATYHALPGDRRRRLHLAAADVADAASVLAHRVAATDHLDDALADDLDAAAQAAPPAHAAQLLRWSATLTTDRHTAESRLLRAARALLTCADFATLNGMRAELAACAPSQRRSLVDAELAWHDGDAAAAERHLDDAVGGADRMLAARAWLELSTVYSTHGRGTEAIDAATRAIELGDGDTVIEHTARTARAVGIAMLEGAAAGLDDLAGLLPAAATDVPPAAAPSLAVRGMLHHFAARPTAAITDLRELTGRLRPTLHPGRLRRSYVHLAQSQFIAGQWDDALLNGHIALDLLIEDDHVWEQAQAHQVLSYVHAGRGDWDDARRHVAAAEAAAATAGTGESWFGAQLAAMAVHRARHEPHAVLATIEPLVGDGAHVTMYTTLGWWVPYVHAMIEIGRLDDAEVQLDLLVVAAAARRIEMTSRTTALRAELQAARGRVDEAATLFARATTAVIPDDPLLDVAVIHVDHARLLRRVGQRHAAVESLRTARGLLEPVGAVPYLAPIDAALAEAGLARPKRGRGSPLDLTPREHDVVLLAARGMTNKEIAADLYISAKAVEYHLGNVYAKLGLSSRRQLRELALI